MEWFSDKILFAVVNYNPIIVVRIFTAVFIIARLQHNILLLSLLLDPEGGSQKVTLVVVLLVVRISSSRSKNP